MDSDYVNPPEGYYSEPGTQKQRWWDGSRWGESAPPTVAPPHMSIVRDPQDGHTIQVVGYWMLVATAIIPFLMIAGVILGIITCTKPGRGGHGAAIICLHLFVGIFAWVVWAAIIGAIATSA